MKTKLQIKSIFGKLLFEYECENNTIRKTLEKAVKEKANLSLANLSLADLSSANLSLANLRSANLSLANLRSANLSLADLSSADLSSANLSSADLSSANLSSADLRSANLSSANLRSANLSLADLSLADLSSADLSSANLSLALNKEYSYMPQFCKWSHSIKGEKIQIGCKEKTISEWDEFFDGTETYSTLRDTDDFKQIQAIFESYKAYINFLNK